MSTEYPSDSSRSRVPASFERNGLKSIFPCSIKPQASGNFALKGNGVEFSRYKAVFLESCFGGANGFAQEFADLVAVPVIAAIGVVESESGISWADLDAGKNLQATEQFLVSQNGSKSELVGENPWQIYWPSEGRGNRSVVEARVAEIAAAVNSVQNSRLRTGEFPAITSCSNLIVKMSEP